MKKVLMCVLVSGDLLVPALPGQVAKERQENQKARTKEGVASGELTKREARGLAKDQKQINREKQAAKADGVVTKGEKAKITHDQTKESKKIAREKHNKRER